MDSKKNFTFIYIIVLIAIVGIALFLFFKNGKVDLKNGDYFNSARLATEEGNSNILGNTQAQGEINNKINNILISTEDNKAKVEDEISSYSTSLSGSSEGRLTNIRITCDTLNGYTVAPGETFSFCNVVGPSTAEKGYKEAPVIEHRKNYSSLRWW